MIGMDDIRKIEDKRKELRVFVSEKQISRWIFLEKLGLCFKSNGDGSWESINYDTAIQICKRIVSRVNNNGVKVEGSFVEDLQRDAMVTKLLSEGKIVLGGVQ